MNFYAGRISLLQINDNLFYTPGKEKNIRYFTKQMSENFEKYLGHKITIINEPWIHPEKGYFGGILGRKGTINIPDRDEYGFKKREQEFYPYVHYFFIEAEQIILIEKNSNVFKNNEKVFGYLTEILNEHLYSEGLSIYIRPLTTKGKFWDILEDLGEVHEVKFRFVAPNFLGELYKNMSGLLKEVKRQTNASEVEHSLYNDTGHISIPKDDNYTSAVGWIEDGGGSWEAIRRARDGKGRKRVSSKKNLKIFEREIEIEGLTIDELYNILKGFDIGEYKINKDDKEDKQ